MKTLFKMKFWEGKCDKSNCLLIRLHNFCKEIEYCQKCCYNHKNPIIRVLRSSFDIEIGSIFHVRKRDSKEKIGVTPFFTFLFSSSFFYFSIHIVGYNFPLVCSLNKSELMVTSHIYDLGYPTFINGISTKSN